MKKKITKETDSSTGKNILFIVVGSILFDALVMVPSGFLLYYCGETVLNYLIMEGWGIVLLCIVLFCAKKWFSWVIINLFICFATFNVFMFLFVAYFVKHLLQ